MLAMLGISSVWFIVEYVVLHVVDSGSDGELKAPPRVLLERECVADAETSAEGRSSASVVLDAELSVEGEVVPSESQMRACIEAFIAFQVVADLRLQDDASELEGLLEIVKASRVIERKGYREMLREGVFDRDVGVSEADAYQVGFQLDEWGFRLRLWGWLWGWLWGRLWGRFWGRFWGRGQLGLRGCGITGECHADRLQLRVSETL